MPTTFLHHYPSLQQPPMVIVVATQRGVAYLGWLTAGEAPILRTLEDVLPPGLSRTRKQWVWIGKLTKIIIALNLRAFYATMYCSVCCYHVLIISTGCDEMGQPSSEQGRIIWLLHHWSHIGHGWWGHPSSTCAEFMLVKNRLCMKKVFWLIIIIVHDCEKDCSYTTAVLTAVVYSRRANSTSLHQSIVESAEAGEYSDVPEYTEAKEGTSFNHTCRR